MDGWEIFAVIVLSQSASIYLFRTFPDFIGGALLKSIEQRNNLQIERVRAELGMAAQGNLENIKADYANLKASADFLSANQAELRSKMIEAVEALWANMIAIKKALAEINYIETILLPNELDDAFSGKKRPDLIDSVNKYKDESYITAKVLDHGTDKFSIHRLFVGDRLWLTYFVFGAVYFRTALLVNRSFLSKKYNNWRTDELIRSHLSAVLGEAVLKSIFAEPFQAFPKVISALESEFLKEAIRIMSGSRVFAETIIDVRATLQYETEKAHELTKNRQM